MEQIDPVQAQRVWQRVRGQEPEEPETLSRLLTLEAEIRHICQYLQRNTHLRDSRMLTRLREESGGFYSILSGLSRLLEADVTVTAPASIRGTAEGLLRQCWKNRQISLSLLPGLPREVPPQLKNRMEHNALLMLELLGQLPRT